MKITDISIIIPIYNVEKYLAECLESVINQSKENIEILCIDDCSTDRSFEITQMYAEKDSRIKLIRNDENRGCLYARKMGVLMAEGKYIMFLDGDDFYSTDACATAYDRIVTESVDILQFGINIINKGNAPQYEVDSLSKFVIPYLDRIDRTCVLKYCFIDEKYSYNVCNKIYKAELCKQAFKVIDDRHYCMAEDMLAYFVIAYYADSYCGIEDRLYNYNFAIGISKPGRLDLEGLDKRCAGAESVAAVERFLIKENALKQYYDIFKKMERRILSDNFDAWYYRLPSEYREQGYEIFEKHWGKDKVILGLLYDIENKQYDINQKGYLIENNNKELEDRKTLIEQLNHTIDEKQALLQHAKEEIEAYQKQEASLKAEYDHVVGSLSYKAGRFITWIPRKIAKAVRMMK
jgi:glycosyltransferase involved in cell wall biosynthesis